MKSKIGLVICLFLICSCDSHDFMLYRWRTIFYHIRHAIFSIEPIDSLSNSCSYYIVLRERKPHREVDTLPLRKRIPHKFNAKERSPLTQKFQYKPLYIKLQPNTKYIITHEGMGSRVNIIKYYHTDSLGKLHPDD